MLGNRAIAAGRSEIDLAAPDFIAQLQRHIAGRELTAIINAAAYTQVDKAEGEGREQAMRINGSAVGELAAWCHQRGLPLVHYSTDYVFDGTGTEPHKETDAANPINAYGRSKLAGERAIIERGGIYLILRTSWVYGAHGKNFFNTILRLLHERDSISVVADQRGTPTYAPHLAHATIAALTAPVFPTGLYHLCNAGQTSWHGFAEAIFALARTVESGQGSPIRCQHVLPIPSSAYPLPAPRPLNSLLDCSYVAARLGISLPAWDAALKECIEEKYADSRLRTGRIKNSTT
jgi:dTDP-4-dehydrorhamnose reductase